MAGLFRGLTGGSEDAVTNSDRVGRLRVLVIGNSGSGKTSLAHLLASGEPLARTTTTVGCNTFVKLVEYQEGGGHAAGDRKQRYFVELWDVGTHERYKALRSVFYSQLNGVILVHELANGRSTAGLGRWAAEVARQGTFAAPLPEAAAAAALGALPVPYLTIANKADLAGGNARPRPLRRSPLLCWLDSLSFAALQGWLAAQLRRWRKGNGGGGSSDKLLGQPPAGDATAAADVSHAGAGLTASATEGRIDVHAVDAFFRDLIERRYYSATRSGGLYPASGPVSQGSSRLSGPPAPLHTAPSGSLHGGNGASFFGGSGPPSGSSSRPTLSAAASLSAAGSLSSSGVYGLPGVGGGGGSAYSNAADRLAQLNSGRIDDLDF